jgi:hypothetical protein
MIKWLVLFLIVFNYDQGFTQEVSKTRRFRITKRFELMNPDPEQAKAGQEIAIRYVAYADVPISIHIFDLNHRRLFYFDSLPSQGLNAVHVKSLEKGTYLYSLNVAGRIVDTKLLSIAGE